MMNQMAGVKMVAFHMHDLALDRRAAIVRLMRVYSTLTLPGLKVGIEPVCPEASGPRVAVEGAQSKNAPLLGFQCRVEPKRLAKHPENACPTSPAFTLVLREPDRNNSAQGDADLI
jgi:hypothetical protein